MSEKDGERAALEEVRAAFEKLGPHLRFVWSWGDGDSGFLADELRAVAVRYGVATPPEKKAEPPVGYIGRSLARRVHERDQYRCQECGDWHELEVDHVLPLARGGPTVLENLQTLCGPCNRAKGAS